MDMYHISADCTSLSLCSYQYVSTRCLEVVSSGHVVLHGPEVELEYLLSTSAEAWRTSSIFGRALRHGTPFKQWDPPIVRPVQHVQGTAYDILPPDQC